MKLHFSAFLLLFAYFYELIQDVVLFLYDRRKWKVLLTNKLWFVFVTGAGFVICQVHVSSQGVL